jgi:hypothetical protein
MMCCQKAVAAGSIDTLTATSPGDGFGARS